VCVDCKLICDQLLYDLDSFSEIIQDLYIDIIEHSGPDAKINRPELNDSGGNSGDGQAIAIVSDGYDGDDTNDYDDD
jgi:hypothetical protein